MLQQNMPDLTSAKIRRAAVIDIPRVIDLERRCPSAAHWMEAQYQKFFQQQSGGSERLILVAEIPWTTQSVAKDAAAELAGFLVAVHVASEWELENIAVSPTTRRRGIGRQLLAALLDEATRTSNEAVFLEVRESNTAARALYKKAGFTQIGRRKDYYPDTSLGTQEDAILYRRNLTV
jgi:ribosomal-protein-alanine acetyltransferase